MKISSVDSTCNTAVTTSIKTVTTPSKKHRRPRHTNALGSYLAITAGAAAVSLPNADGAVVYYNGSALTVGLADTNRWLYFSPLATAGNPTLGVRAGIDDGSNTQDRFQIFYNSANYVYTDKNESLLRMDWGYSNYDGDALLKLGSNATIDLNSNSWFNKRWVYMNALGWTTAESPWATGEDGTTGFIPFRFALATAPSDYYYGWAEYTYNNGATQSLTLNNFAYENTPNTSITTEVVPEPSSLLLLALGGSSVLLARRRRMEKQTLEPLV